MTISAPNCLDVAFLVTAQTLGWRDDVRIAQSFGAGSKFSGTL